MNTVYTTEWNKIPIMCVLFRPVRQGCWGDSFGCKSH